jgi:hypothetical protein
MKKNKTIYSVILIGLFFSIINVTLTIINHRQSAQNVSISDYVFDYYYDGKLRAEDANKYPNFKILSLVDAETFIKNNRHLPYIDSRTQWEKYSKLPLEKLVSQQWVALEILWLHTIEQQKQIDELKKMMASNQSTDVSKLSDGDLIKIIRENRNNPSISIEELKIYKSEFERRGLQLE